ncbi:hypothetical protein J2S13_003015 [Oikeobacillus pervagus]|uniref:Cytosolic protein n=1 Tax=Oikeobacillus pervagus TaxID=1325931 RepID=A0AAJ1WKF7_9BACI|nr:DUF6154 family protein [Oikeobacillus pervagus]MDQ0216553.1 hypothetical protein [Oikeobacillus pervagus]
MKLVDELFEIYRGRLQGTDEDLDMIALAVIEQFDRNELMEMVYEMKEEELQYFIRLYLLEMLKEKFSKDDTNSATFRPNFLH